MTELTKSIPTKIDRTDLPRLKAYAAAHRWDCVEALHYLLADAVSDPPHVAPRGFRWMLIPDDPALEAYLHQFYRAPDGVVITPPADVNPDADSHDYRED
jgi:hypothetical protein